MKPRTRKLYDMKEVIYDQEWFSKMENFDVYYMFRDEILEKDKIKLTTQNLKYDLRYDITIIPPLMLGCEYPKTLGHYHPKVPGYNLSYPEIYEVIRGKCYFLMQKGIDKIEDVVIVEADTKDKVIIPPDYGHVTINISDNILETANWIGNFESIYNIIKERSGMSYYILKDGFIKNNNYHDFTEIRKIKPVEIPEIGIQRDKELYDFVDNIKMLEFLIKPQEYAWLFEKVVGRNG